MLLTSFTVTATQLSRWFATATLASFPNEHAVELVEQEIAKQQGRREDQGRFPSGKKGAGQAGNILCSIVWTHKNRFQSIDNIYH